MRVSFGSVNNSISFKCKYGSKLNSSNKKRTMFGDLGFSLGVGVTMGGLAAGVMRYKRLPNIFVNSFDFGSVFSYLTYMSTLIAKPFRVS